MPAGATVTPDELAHVIFSRLMAIRIFHDIPGHNNSLMMAKQDLPTELQIAKDDTIEQALEIVKTAINARICEDNDLCDESQVLIDKERGLFGISFDEGLERDEILSALDDHQEALLKILQHDPTAPVTHEIISSEELAKLMAREFLDRDFEPFGPDAISLQIRLGDLEAKLPPGKTLTYDTARMALAKLTMSAATVLGCDRPRYGDIGYNDFQEPNIRDSRLVLIFPEDIEQNEDIILEHMGSRLEFLDNAIDLSHEFATKGKGQAVTAILPGVVH